MIFRMKVNSKSRIPLWNTVFNIKKAVAPRQRFKYRYIYF